MTMSMTADPSTTSSSRMLDLYYAELRKYRATERRLIGEWGNDVPIIRIAGFLCNTCALTPLSSLVPECTRNDPGLCHDRHPPVVC
jgi:hypothetical protein